MSRRPVPFLGALAPGLLVVLLTTAIAVPVPGSVAAEPEIPEGTLSGTVTDVEGTPLAGIRVELYNHEPRDPEVGESYRTTTGPDGRWSVRVTAGLEWEVVFVSRNAATGPWASAHWDDDPTDGRAGVVRVGAGEARDGIDARLRRTASVSGRVVGPGGDPLRGVRVDLWFREQYSEGWYWTSWQGETRDDGTYTVYALPGSYPVGFELRRTTSGSPSPPLAPHSYPSGGGAPGEGRPIALDWGTEVTGIDARLVPGSRVAGRVLLDGRLSDVVRPSVSVSRRVDGVWTSQPSGAHVDDDGRYVVDGLPAGSYRVLVHETDTANDVFYPGVSTAGRAAVVEVPASATVELADVALPRRGWISGTVRDEEGRPVVGHAVHLVSPWKESGGYWGGTVTDERGQYELTGLTRGFYRVALYHLSGEFTVAWWPRSRTLRDAVDLAVEPGRRITGVNLTVPRARLAIEDRRATAGPRVVARVRAARPPRSDKAIVPGRMRGTHGAHLSGVHVLAYRLEGRRWVRRGREGVSHAMYGYYGPRYAVTVPGGRYRLLAVDRTWRFWASEWLGGARTASRSRTTVVDPRVREQPYRNFWLEPQVRAFEAPRVVGRPTVGALLRVRTGLWSPHDVRLGYRWLRDSRPVPGATGPGYRVRPADRGSVLTVQVVGRRPGMLPRTTTSAPQRVR